VAAFFAIPSQDFPKTSGDSDNVNWSKSNIGWGLGKSMGSADRCQHLQTSLLMLMMGSWLGIAEAVILGFCFASWGWFTYIKDHDRQPYRADRPSSYSKPRDETVTSESGDPSRSRPPGIAPSSNPAEPIASTSAANPNTTSLDGNPPLIHRLRTWSSQPESSVDTPRPTDCPV
jgi:hypothetical protein